MISRELFSSYVRDALTHFHNPAHLQTHPLVNLCVPQGTPEETRGQSLRELLADILESLRPTSSIPFNRPEWFGYRVMWLRYLECLSPPQACREIGLSQTSFYRYHREALEAFVSMLWDRYQGERASRAEGQEKRSGPVADELVKAEALKIARASGRQAVQLSEILQAAHSTMLPLVRQRGITLLIDAPGDLPVVYADPAMLRQIILNVFTEGLKLARANTLRLAMSTTGDEIMLRLLGLDESKAATQNIEAMTGLAISRGLLDIYGGRLWFERDKDHALTLCFAVPCAKPQMILIIDDDTDTTGLYRRYLQSQAYIIREANSGEQSWALLSKVKPDLILLDVLMPQEDGWDILQRLKKAPETADVPVVICSVLSQPHLALALGAAKVLQKPIGQDTLLRTVQRFLASPSPGHNAIQ